MSKKTESKPSQGQQGPELKLHFSELTENEEKLVKALAQPGRPIMTIKELVIACRWRSLKQGDTENEDHVGKARGNSRVRNTLRRLVRSHWVEHAEEIGDASYRLSSQANARLRRLKPAKRVKVKIKEEVKKAG